MSNIYCPLCDSQESDIIFTHGRLANIRRTYRSKESAKQLITKMNTVLCKDCGMLFRKPLLTDDELKRYYENDYVRLYKQKPKKLNYNSDITYNELLSLQKRYHIKHFNFLTKNGINFKEKKVLDVGCGPGWFLAILKDKKTAYRLGIEPSKQHYIEIKNREEFNFKVLPGCIRDYSLKELGVFDLITMIGVLEHLSNPVADLKACRDVMSDDSYIYIYTHNETPNLFIDINKRISLVHQLYFTPRTISILFNKAGLRIMAMESRGTDMHILAKKREPIRPKYKLNKVQYSLLKNQYLICKNFPSSYFVISSWFYAKYLAMKDRLLNNKLSKYKNFQLNG